MKTLGERIRELREERDLSLREFAKKLGGLSAAFLSDIELSRRNPSDKVLEAMARVLRIAVEDLRKYDTRPPVEDLRRLVTANPAYGVALRRIVDKKISAEELMRLTGRSKGSSKKQ